jgi:hypothetical protein
MKHVLPLILAVAALTGCGSDPGAEVDPAAIESAFKASGDETIETPPPAEESTTDTVVIPVTAAGEVPIKEVANRAAAAMRKDEVTEAMVLLQSLRRAKNLSADQLTAVQDQMAALQSSLANRAQSGDLKAKQALELMQQSTRW